MRGLNTDEAGREAATGSLGEEHPEQRKKSVQRPEAKAFLVGQWENKETEDWLMEQREKKERH